MKAYLVDCEQEEGAQLYFASTPGRAKAMAAAEAGIEFTEVLSCRRVPKYDQYAPGPVPPKVLIEDGWDFECQGCYRKVHKYIDWDEEHNEPADPVYHGDRVWHSQRCFASWDERETKRELERQAAIDATLKRWPLARDVRADQRANGQWWVWFSFGGGWRALWRAGSEEWPSVASHDLVPWVAFADKCRVEAAKRVDTGGA